MGVAGEELAKIHLVNIGYRIIGENVRVGHKEIDLIAQDRGVTVFVEVKARAGDKYGVPQEAVTPEKLRRLHQAFALYARRHPEMKQVRFDVIAITYRNREQKPLLQHLKGIIDGEPLAFLS